MMDHPNIARVLDAGATTAGRPYFVMELVRGIRITDYCDQSNLSTAARLDLFIQVCHAIQHAHQKGIIHRDIKPSNILVSLHDGRPMPVIIDFGIAKATEQRLTDKTLFTAFEQFIGTPAYMSPEQAEMSRLDIDTRSDLYSLGVLLYELLTGKTPFDPATLLQSGLDEMRRTIREREPPRPSTRLSTMLEADLTTVAKHRQAEPLRLISQLRGDLDWIVMKCLEKDRTRRYETANGLALDVQRYLQNEPVLARPPSRWYRFQKMIRRNQVAFVAGTGVALALVAGLGVSTYLFLLEKSAYRRAVVAEQNQSRLRQEAEEGQGRESTLRALSESNAQQSRLNSYAGDVYSAFLALQTGNLGRAFDLLEHQIPSASAPELRGFEWRYLWQEAQGDELLSLPHDALVSCAVFGRNGQQLATASYDGSVRIWDLHTRQVVRTIDGFETQFGWRYIDWSSDGHWLAGVRGGKLTVWAADPEKGDIVFEANSVVKVVAFSSDSQTLAAWGGSELILVDTSTWQSTRFSTRLNAASFPALAFDRAGKRLALADEGKFTIEVWNLDERRPERMLPFEHRGRGFVSLAWSTTGLLAASTWSGTVMLIQPETGQELASAKAHTGTTFGLAFSPDGETLVTAGHDQLIHFWSVPGLQRRYSLHGHRDEIWSLAFSPDGRLLATAGKEGAAKIWSSDPKPPVPYLTNLHAGAFGQGGKVYVTLPQPLTNLTLNFWEVDNPRVRTTKSLPVTNPSSVTEAVLSSDGSLIAVQKGNQTLEVWNVDSGKLLQTRSVQGPAVQTVEFSPQGRFLALGTAVGQVEVWNLKSGQTVRLGDPELGPMASVRFSPGTQLVLASAPTLGRTLLWDLKSGKELPLPVSNLDRIQVSPDGRLVAATSSNNWVKVWELPSLRECALLKSHRWTINTLAFSEDSQVLATASGDAVAHIWDPRTGAEVTRPLRGHLQGVTELAFSPDGKVLATGSTDNSVKIWHVATGRELFSVPEASEPAFSPDGNTLLVHTARGLRLLHAPPLETIDAARKEAVGRD